MKRRQPPTDTTPTSNVCKIVGVYEGVGEVVVPVRKYPRLLTRERIQENLANYPIPGLGKEKTD